jgi:hypothetical protein
MNSTSQFSRAKLLPALMKRLLFVAVLTAAANHFLWLHRIGINLPVYAGIVALGMIASARGVVGLRSFWVLVVLLASSILAGANAASFSNFFCLATILTLLAGICFYVLSLWGAPFRWGTAAVVANRLHRRGKQRKPNWLFVPQILFVGFATAIPVLLVGNFVISGNLILGQWFSSIVDRLLHLLPKISFVHVTFLIVFATMALGFVWPGRRRWRLPSFRWTMPSSPAAAPIRIWGARLTLWLLNLLFLSANTIDALFLWLRTRPPVGVTYSEFVHHGTNSLIFATICSAVVIILILERFPVSNARVLRWAAVIWIAQNILLIFGVFRRLKLYVDVYNLTILRVDVALFLLLVLTGFLLLGIYVVQQRRFGWLCSSGSLTVCTLFYLLQFCDLGGFVASYNVDRWLQPTAKTQVDLCYLSNLGPGAWRSLERLADSNSPGSESARVALTRIRSKVWQGSLKKKPWQTFQWRRYLCEQQLIHWQARATE